MRVLFILPGRGGGGGAHSVVQESLGMQRLGATVGIATTRATLPAFTANYPEVNAARLPIHPYADPGEIAGLLARYDICCATTWESVHMLAGMLEGSGKGIRTAYYVQDYEPLFCAPGTIEWQRARQSYVELPDAVLFAKTGFLRDIVGRNHGKPVARVSASIDHEIYHPGLADDDETLAVSAMIRPKTLRRAPRRTARILERLADAHGDAIRISAFGATRDELQSAGIRLSERIECHGALSRREVAAVLRLSTMFLDLSDYQAFGRTGLEAMACGCVPLLPLFGGAGEFVEHWRNGLLIDTRSDDEIMTAVEAFAALPVAARARMRMAAIATALDYTIDKAAFSEMRLFQTMLA